jgi:hypothetical protein
MFMPLCKTSEVDEMAENQAETIKELPNLRQRLIAAMTDVGSVAKAGQNKEQHYSFQRAADIFASTQDAFAKHGIAFLSSEKTLSWPETHESKNGGTVFVCVATMEFTLFNADGDKEDKMTATHSGVAFDTSDKALNKAKTAALKYFLKQTLLIGEDEDDGDAETLETRGSPASACPKCGVIGAIIKGRPEYGGGWVCWTNKGGCGAKFQTDPAGMARQGAQDAAGGAQGPSAPDDPDIPWGEPKTADTAPRNVKELAAGQPMPLIPDSAKGTDKISRGHAIWITGRMNKLKIDMRALMNEKGGGKPGPIDLNYDEFMAIASECDYIQSKMV